MGGPELKQKQPKTEGIQLLPASTQHGLVLGERFGKSHVLHGMFVSDLCTRSAVTLHPSPASCVCVRVSSDKKVHRSVLKSKRTSPPSFSVFRASIQGVGLPRATSSTSHAIARRFRCTGIGTEMMDRLQTEGSITKFQLAIPYVLYV